MPSFVYLANRFLYRIVEFLRHWYVDSFHFFSHATINFLERLDNRLALKVTFRHWLRPLYQDYTLIGYTLGFLFRTSRIIIGGIVYFLVIVTAVALYILWAILPAYIIYRGILS